MLGLDGDHFFLIIPPLFFYNRKILNCCVNEHCEKSQKASVYFVIVVFLKIKLKCNGSTLIDVGLISGCSSFGYFHSKEASGDKIATYSFDMLA